MAASPDKLIIHHYPCGTEIKIPDRVARSMSEPPFIIYYRVIEIDRVVEVMTIRRGTRKQPRRFKR